MSISDRQAASFHPSPARGAPRIFRPALAASQARPRLHISLASKLLRIASTTTPGSRRRLLHAGTAQGDPPAQPEQLGRVVGTPPRWKAAGQSQPPRFWGVRGGTA
jgi:hypothetical protein